MKAMEGMRMAFYYIFKLTNHSELIRAKLWLLWKPANDTGIDFVMTGRSDGYIAVGFTGENPIYFGSGKMIGAEAVVGWMNANGTPVRSHPRT